jgi:hypothetical protein
MTDVVATKYLLYIDGADKSSLMRDTTAGKREVKGAATQYRPQPSGFSAQADGGKALYEVYQKRGQFPQIVHPTAKNSL